MKAAFILVGAALLSATITSAPQTFSPDAEGFIRNWLVLAPIAIEGDSGAAELDKEFINNWQGCARFLVNRMPVKNFTVSLTAQ